MLAASRQTVLVTTVIITTVVLGLQISALAGLSISATLAMRDQGIEG